MCARTPGCALLSRPPQCWEWEEERGGSKTITENGALYPGCEALFFPKNRMQISINSINGQCLLAIKIAQRLLVSGCKMDDQWPRRSQRSKMTITLKCNLCCPPAPGLGGGAGAAGHQCSLPSQAVLSHAASSAQQLGRWPLGITGYPASLSSQAESPHVYAHTAAPHAIPQGAAKEQDGGLVPAPRPPLGKQTLAPSAPAAVLAS